MPRVFGARSAGWGGPPADGPSSDRMPKPRRGAGSTSAVRAGLLAAAGRLGAFAFAVAGAFAFVTGFAADAFAADAFGAGAVAALPFGFGAGV